jgi:hypothetical protein
MFPVHGLREGRVRPEAAHAYPWAPRDEWLPAGELANLAVRHSGEFPTRRRALADEVFEFRGGRPELVLRRRARTRWSDHPAQVSGTRRR